MTTRKEIYNNSTISTKPEYYGQTGRAWAIDGSFYTEDKKTIESFLTGLYTPGKKDYTITDENGNAIALLQID